jgi:hypothetical protein
MSRKQDPIRLKDLGEKWGEEATVTNQRQQADLWQRFEVGDAGVADRIKDLEVAKLPVSRRESVAAGIYRLGRQAFADQYHGRARECFSTMPGNMGRVWLAK